LLAIADLCGGDWGNIAREAAVQLSGVDDDETNAIMLLQDLKNIFAKKRAEEPDALVMSSAEMAEKLAEMACTRFR
jgi:hypothetical protein